MWLSEPDYSGHHSPLGSPQHRAAIAAADRCVRQVFETVRRLDPSGDDILSSPVRSRHGDGVGSDRYHRAAGLRRLKSAPDSRDVVVAPQGISATIFFSDAARDRVAATADFLARENWPAGSSPAPSSLRSGCRPTPHCRSRWRWRPTTG